MKTARIEVWVWVLVYAGLVVFGTGLAVQRSDDSLGWGIAGVGALLAAAGALLVWIRSRMKNTDTPQPEKPAP
jgi:membrane protein DedA with SNARE-associated domain